MGQTAAPTKQNKKVLQLIFSIASDRMSTIFSSASLGSKMVSNNKRLRWETWGLRGVLHLRISHFFATLRANKSNRLWEKVALVAESSFKSNKFGTQGILTPNTSSECATRDQTSEHLDVPTLFVNMSPLHFYYTMCKEQRSVPRESNKIYECIENASLESYNLVMKEAHFPRFFSIWLAPPTSLGQHSGPWLHSTGGSVISRSFLYM